MVNCCVPGCASRQGNVRGVTFHKFPKNEQLREKWTIAVKRDNWMPTPFSFVCSKHFPEADMDRTSLLRPIRLRENVVPSVFESFPSNLQKKKVSRKLLKQQETNMGQPKSKKNTPQNTNQDSQPQPSPTSLPPHPTSVLVVVSAPPQRSRVLNTPAQAVTNIDTPRERHLRRQLKQSSEQLHLARKKISTLQQTVRRFKKRNASLRAVVAELRSQKSQPEEKINDLIENTLTGAAADILKRQMKDSSRDKSKYSPELQAFATTLLSHSPRAYDYVRKVFNTCLPHRRTLRRWYDADARPGFTPQSMEFLEHFASDTDAAGRELLWVESNTDINGQTQEHHDDERSEASPSTDINGQTQE